MTMYRKLSDNMEAMRRAYALRLLEQASSTAPVQHPLQALARTLQGGLAAHYARQREQQAPVVQHPENEAFATAPAPIPLAKPSEVPFSSFSTELSGNFAHAAPASVSAMSYRSPGSEAVRSAGDRADNRFGIAERRKEANQLANLYAVPPLRQDYDDRNSIEHSYTSATLQRDYGDRPSHLAQNLGNTREILDLADYSAKSILNWLKRKPNVKSIHPDSWKDLWNNAIGRQIGEYVRKNNLSQNDLERLLMQAHRRGDLIRRPDDPRIPKNPSGWPGDFPPAGTRGAPVWAGPDSGWQPEPGEGIAKRPIPPI